MALTNNEITKTWQGWVKVAITDARPANYSKAEMIQVVQAVDAWADANAASYNAALPAFFRTGARAASADEKTVMLAATLIMRTTIDMRKAILHALGESNG